MTEVEVRLGKIIAVLHHNHKSCTLLPDPDNKFALGTQIVSPIVHLRSLVPGGRQLSDRSRGDQMPRQLSSVFAPPVPPDSVTQNVDAKQPRGGFR